MRTLLILVFVFSFTKSNSQVTDYFLHNPEWRLTSSCMDMGQCMEIDNYVYYLNGDTLISGLTYKKVYKRGEIQYTSFGGSCPPSTVLHNNLFALLRQDSMQLFHYSTLSNQEELLYDFSLNIGDFLPQTEINFSPDIQVVSIDSMLIGAEYRRVLSCSDPEGVITELVEGIGANTGLFEPMDVMFDCGWIFNCYALNGQSYYPDSLSSCELNVSLKEFENRSLNVYPNPTQNVLNIDIHHLNQVKVISIFDILGSVQTFTSVKLNGTIRLDVQDFNKGIYFIKTEMQNGDFYSSVFVKE